MNTPMRIAHVALWTRDLDGAAGFCQRYLGADIGPLYASERRPGFVSRFVTLPASGHHLELMTGPWVSAPEPTERTGWDHIAIAVPDKAGVDAMAARCNADGILVSGPRTTGDGHYEAVIRMPDGTRIEITAE